MRTAITITAVTLVGATAMQAQVGPRRAATPAALVAFAGFYQGQPVVVRGTLATREAAVLLSPSLDRSIPVVFRGRSPNDGPVELRGTFWDLGRLAPEDPRLVTNGLDRLLPQGVEGEWPRPGEIVAMAVTDAMSLPPHDGAPSLREIALEPEKYAGQRVTIKGQFRGRNLYGDLPQGPGLSRWDFVLRSADASLWITGARPRGRGFNLDTDARVDTGIWLEATGVVREGKGLAWLEAQRLTLSTPEVDTRTIEPAPAPQIGPTPEVIFSDPLPGEADVPMTHAVRLQFSRDMNAASFRGNVRWRYAGQGADMQSATEPQPAEYSYDGAKRALEIHLGSDELLPYRTVQIELLDGIAAADGARMAPWTLRFSFAGQ